MADKKGLLVWSRELEMQYSTAEEIALRDLRVALVGELIKARDEKGMTQARLEELTGVKQSMISRIERGRSMPQVDTLIRLLAPLGKTLGIVPMDGQGSEKDVAST